MTSVLQRAPFLRSVLFAPANHTRRVARIIDFGADAVTLDLEDAVAASEKIAAREAVGPALATYKGVLRCVRVNALVTGLTFGDLESIVGPNLDCVIAPKIESSSDLNVFNVVLARLEEERRIPPGSIRLIPIIESARAVLHAEEIVHQCPERVETLLFGIGDYTVDLGIEPSEHGTELIYARSRLVVCCRAYGLAPPIDGPYLKIGDKEGLRFDSKRSRDLGFQGRLVIHPDQVAVVNEVYGSLSLEELAQVRRIVEAFEAAEASGSASIQVDGGFVDYPIYRLARQRFDRHMVSEAVIDELNPDEVAE